MVAPPLTSTTVELTWSNGHDAPGHDPDLRSVAEVDAVVSRTGGSTIVAATGEIVSGRFAGAQFSDQVVCPSPDLAACLIGGGVTHVGAVATMTVTDV